MLINILFSISPIFIGQKRPEGIKTCRVNFKNSYDIKIYQPHTSNSLPVIIYYHGGGWIFGNDHCYNRVLHYLTAKSKCLVVCVNYRKAPRFQFPTALNDCFNSYKWVIKNISKYYGNPNNIIIAGDSAGGGLAMSVYQKLQATKIQLPKILVLFYPLFDASNTALRIMLNSRSLFNKMGFLLLWYMKKNYVNKKYENSNLLSIDGNDINKLPKTLIISASIDPLNNQIDQFRKNLKRRKIDTTYKKYSGSMHGFLNLGAIDKNSSKALNYAAKFIKDNIQ